MSIQNYDLRFFSPTGEMLFSFDIFIELEFGRQKNDIGAASLLIPGDIYNIMDFQEDSFLEIWRKDEQTQTLKLFGNTIYLLRAFEYTIDKNNNETIELIFYDTISILQRRFNLWLLSEFTEYPSHMDRPIVDQIIQVFNHNFGNNTNVKDSSMTILGPGSDPNPSQAALFIGPNNRKFELISSFPVPTYIDQTNFNVESAWKNCLELMKELANMSENRNIPVWFDIEYMPTGESTIGTFGFKVWEGIRGNNLTNFDNEIIFSPEYGNLGNVKITFDFRETADAVIVIADETVDSDPTFDEVMQGVALSTDYNILPFHPIELVVEQRKALDILSLPSLAQAELAAKRPIKKISGEIINVPGNQFGINYNYGDIVVVKIKDLTFAAEITKFNVNVNNNGEQINIPIESTTLIV